MSAESIRIALATVIAAVFIAVLATKLVAGGGSSSERPDDARSAVVLSEAELLERAATLEHSAYWLGARPGIDSYELETTADGSIYIRYLDGESTVGDSPADALTVATYPLADARGALERAARTSTEGQTLSPHRGFLTLSGGGTHNAYVVFDDQPELQIEIYSPRTGEGAKLAASGAPRELP